jgi:CubicO group peptidase (beta-lactamase class C family)
VKLIRSGIVLPPRVAALARGRRVAALGDVGRRGISTARFAHIATWYQARVDGGDLPGAVIAIAHDGKLALLHAAGFKDHAKHRPMQPDAIFWIASMTKPITSVGAMILAQEGTLDLDEPVDRYLPELKHKLVATEDGDPAKGRARLELVPQERAMTVRDLLRHTSGLVYPPQYSDSALHQLYGEKAIFARNRTLAEFVASLSALPLAHQPGTVWEYSWGVDVLARVVEVVSGRRFDKFLEDRVFGPLQMVDTSFHVPQAKLARLVDPPAGGRPALWDVTKSARLFSGGGGLVSTATDYLRFCQMLLNRGELDGARILAPETVDAMTTNSLSPTIRFAQDMVGPEAGCSWGLGVAIRTVAERSHVPGRVGSYSWGGIWGTLFWIDPAEKLAAVLMIQVPPGESAPYRDALATLIYGALHPPL